MLNLSEIKPRKGATKKKKRVGRGNASGHGTYSCRGQKGQRSRSGASGLKRLGMKKQLLQIPKVRGFKSLKPQNQVINLNDLNEHFKDGAKISPAVLVKKGLIKKVNKPVKLLGKGELKIKGLSFQNIKISEKAQEAIDKKEKNA